MIIVARKTIGLRKLSPFAYLFGLFIILVLIQHFGQLAVRTHFKTGSE